MNPEIDHSVSPEKYIDMPDGLDGYWWETETQICVADIHSRNPRAFIGFLNVIEGKGKPVFFPTLVNARLDKLLRLRGYQDAFVKGEIFGDPEIFDGLAKLPNNKGAGSNISGKERMMKTTGHNEPRQMFIDSVVEFYEKLGSKKFWADMKQRTIVLEALSQDYMRTDHTGYKEEDATTLRAALNEYRLRERHMMRLTQQ
ncbi:hypothetical protein LCGC14_1330810 [marine sediment metagenome]|uniref:Uncharacterized protein n=1 Tax=marine sediment metagenome TaxID=412755 RepID=A0A0F9KGP9_9ZZZZ